MHTKLTIGASLFVVVLIVAAVTFWGATGEQNTSVQSGGETRAAVAEAVIENGVQYVDIEARAGYTPRNTRAQAGIPTVIRMTTDNTYDCSLALVIRDLDHQSFLPQSGITEIEVPAEKARGTLRGMCSMAMYHFEIEFRE